MRVKLRTNLAGPGGVTDAGAEVELDDAEAQDLIARGFATLVGGALAAPIPGGGAGRRVKAVKGPGERR